MYKFLFMLFMLLAGRSAHFSRLKQRANSRRPPSWRCRLRTGQRTADKSFRLHLLKVGKLFQLLSIGGNAYCVSQLSTSSRVSTTARATASVSITLAKRSLPHPIGATRPVYSSESASRCFLACAVASTARSRSKHERRMPTVHAVRGERARASGQDTTPRG